MNAEQRANLLKLANYLDTLEPDYKHFDMSTYACHTGDHEINLEYGMLECPVQTVNDCGTVACAVGHGPAAGLRLIPNEIIDGDDGERVINWSEYQSRAFGVNWYEPLWDFLFSGLWSCADPHHYGAAARIRYYLENGLPPTFGDKHRPYYSMDDIYFENIVSLYAPYRKRQRLMP
jgi:hypothetical protein